MAIPATELTEAARRLQAYLVERHWRDRALAGPDPGIRINWRVGRFVKSYLSALPWSDDLVYMQGQGYWVLDNWLLADLVGDDSYREVALAGTEFALAHQQPDGYWEYPNPEWRGRIATVEGNWATFAALESYRHTGRADFLESARRWHRFLVDQIGFQSDGEDLAVNYFYGDATGKVPNNSTQTILLLAELYEVDRREEYLAPIPGLLRFLERVQKPSGELPYVVEGRDKPHFLCYQYNAFEFLDLWKYERLTRDRRVRPLLERLAGYLATGISPDGAARYNCARSWPEVTYYTAVVSAALSRATASGLGDFGELAERGYRRLLAQQRPDGGFAFSSKNYRVLSDRRSYPRYQAMILHHLLLELEGREHSSRPAVELTSTAPVPSGR